MDELLKNIWATVGEFATSAGIRLVSALLILVIGMKLIKWIIKRVQKGKSFAKLETNSKTLIIDILKVAFYLILIVIIASTLGIETASITAAIASAGLAIGLALQGSLANLAGGFMLLAFKPFSIGDYIDNGTHAGTVKDIGVFYTTLATVDNKIITIPNGVLSNQSVTDFSTASVRRLDLQIGVDYGSDIKEVKRVLTEVAEAHPLVLKKPEAPDQPFVRLGQQDDSALVFFVRVWVKSSDYWTVNFDLMEQTKEKLDENNISIPFPQMDVHIKDEK